MKIVEQIKQPIAYEMELFEQKFQLSMSSKVALLNRITHYIVNRKGKQMRPMFVFLVSKMVSNGEVSERTYRGASVIELIHTEAYLEFLEFKDLLMKNKIDFAKSKILHAKIAIDKAILLSSSDIACVELQEKI